MVSFRNGNFRNGKEIFEMVIFEMVIFEMEKNPFNFPLDHNFVVIAIGKFFQNEKNFF